MKILTKAQMKSLMKKFPGGGIVFTECSIGSLDTLEASLMVTDGDFGARVVVPYEGEVFDFDWNIEEFGDDDLFAVYDNNDVLQMIQTLTSGLQIALKDWCED